MIATTTSTVTTRAFGRYSRRAPGHGREGRDREVDPDQARERGAEGDPDHADDRGDAGEPAVAAGARVEMREPHRERHRRERGEVVLAEERRLPGAEVAEEALDRPDVRGSVHHDEREHHEPQALAAVDHVDGAEHQHADLDELARATNASEPFDRRGHEDPAGEHRRRQRGRARSVSGGRAARITRASVQIPRTTSDTSEGVIERLVEPALTVRCGWSGARISEISSVTRNASNSGSRSDRRR